MSGIRIQLRRRADERQRKFAERVLTLRYWPSIDFAIEQGLANVSLEGIKHSHNLESLIKSSYSANDNQINAKEVILKIRSNPNMLEDYYTA